MERGREGREGELRVVSSEIEKTGVKGREGVIVAIPYG